MTIIGLSRRLLPALAVLAIVILVTSRIARAGDAPLRVVVTTSIIADWIHIVGGDSIELQTLVGPDGDPHEYEPVPADSISLSRADLIFENGLGLESWLDKMCQTAQTRAIRVVVTAGIPIRYLPGSREPDPHAWHNVADAIIMVGNVRDGLSKADPSHAGQYQSRAATYIHELQDLDTWVRKQVETIPPARRKIVTTHDAFGYFGDRYGFDISRSILESVTTEASDPSARQIAEVVEKIRASGVPVIFVENIQSPRLIVQIAAEANVRVGPALYSDALGQPGSDGDSYIKMIQYNVKKIVKELKQ